MAAVGIAQYATPKSPVIAELKVDYSVELQCFLKQRFYTRSIRRTSECIRKSLKFVYRENFFRHR